MSDKYYIAEKSERCFNCDTRMDIVNHEGYQKSTCPRCGMSYDSGTPQQNVIEEIEELVFGE